MGRKWIGSLIAVVGIIVVGVIVYQWRSGEAEFEPEILPLPEGLQGYEEMKIPPDNPMTPEKVALGRQLFFDKRLSADESRSCYSCHLNEKGLSDGLPTSLGALGKRLPRNSPTLWNIGYHHEFYWDGRAPTLERQIFAAWTGGNMSAKPEEVAAKLNQIEGYRRQFRKVFGTDATPDAIVKALAAYTRTIIGGNTAWDRWRAGDENAISEEAKRGWEIFQRIGCTNCHDGLLFTDLQYHNVGIGMDKPNPDLGRYNVTKQDRDRGAFKTPTLRDVARSAPYFHDGSVATLEEAVDIMLAGGKPNPWLDRANLKPAKITPEERQALLAFLRSLTEEGELKEPRLPQK
ncbi:MAG: c-type cytochrome [Blastocatellia bacterium]|nr:c-type cytochrome [Blastocatellia bacterium]MCS7156283.1 c-type cytochrome [Blastocatellia bacterium]MCX7751367.1 c-type cytochrome [Blastocatellia bacterium]MDW8169079.1 cytochrome c peroxidase [Acidobacteriota bacterium]MDW8255784.1 cytochrome c peroxidase [Acidobacteriota bacterium]